MKWKKIFFITTTLFIICLLASGFQQKDSEKNSFITAEDTQKQPMTAVKIEIGEKTFQAKFYENETTKELLKQLPIEMEMQELNGNEKYYYLNQNLPTNASKVHTIKEGDIMLYGKNCLAVFYENFDTNYQYTPIGYVEEVSGFSQALGKGTVKVVLKIAEDSAS